MDTSKEIVHAVFIKIWENRLDFDWEKPAKSYLFTSVYNRSMNVIRDNKKFVAPTGAEGNERIPEKGEFEDILETAELESRIQRALDKLPEKCREVFELNRFQGKKYTEIAEHLKISVKTVESQMSKALKVLKEELKDYLFLVLLCLFIGSGKPLPLIKSDTKTTGLEVKENISPKKNTVPEIGVNQKTGVLLVKDHE